ncbi:MAG: SDR family oxidoreductase [Firmicutes bacterium]|nr:SDR family oxidoreductase [Bacillota bacterium]
MHNKVALVTGGGRGIGAATCTLLAARGAQVVVNYARDESAANRLVGEITQAGGRAMAIQADVRDETQVAQMIESVVQKWGTIDILVSNANMSFALKPLEEMAWSEFAQKLNDEMKAAFVMTKAVTPLMAKQAYGRIVYIASGLAKRAAPRMSAHGSAKAALVTFARYVAQEYGPKGITANIISPGLVRTDATSFQSDDQLARVAAMTPLGHVATPEDVAHAVGMYCSDDTRFVTGVYIPVNGGASME